VAWSKADAYRLGSADDGSGPTHGVKGTSPAFFTPGPDRCTRLKPLITGSLHR
jgi:hypothetical protein